MHNNIFFFQSTLIGGDQKQQGIFDLLLTHINSLENTNLFESVQIVVPNQAMAIWLKDRIAAWTGICANFDFVILLWQVIENIYLANNPFEQLFDFSKAKYIIYDYLLIDSITTDDAHELNHYILQNGKVDKFRVYQLASQLQQIFHEYLYLRTEELLHLDLAKFPLWQKKILNYLFKKISSQKTFLDIYNYFKQLDLNQKGLKLPHQLFIFGLTSVYPSQLQIIKKLAQKINIYWYYQPCSYEYYGDLLSNKAKSRLEKKLLRKPHLSLDDLYLIEGNPLLANLGQQSREFIELLNANDIEVYNFEAVSASLAPDAQTFLSIIQNDIRQIKYRVRPEYRLEKNSKFYAEPFNLSLRVSATLNHKQQSKEDSFPAEKLYDIHNQQTSVKINICHNRMREVQVMFNEVVAIIDKNPGTTLDEILITAPDIDVYAPYIAAVFDNELMQKSDGSTCQVLYNITGNRRHKNYKILNTLKLLINTPFLLTVNYFIEILMQAEIQQNLEMSRQDVDLVKVWLKRNATNFGYTAEDYKKFGYQDYSIHSFKQFLNNLVLGACLNEQILSTNNGLPFYECGDSTFIPYDNIDSSQIKLCNKLISLIDLLEDLRSIFYLNADNYAEFDVEILHQTLAKLQEILLVDDESHLVYTQFLGLLLNINLTQPITLLVLNHIIDEYIDSIKSKISFNGKITCASMCYMRNIPYNYVYILGLNFGEFPKSYKLSQLSILAKEWYMADRNNNIEDKQIFLDIILSVQKRLFLSYIGRKETDNSIIKPSPVLNLFLTTLGHSFSDFWDNQDPTKPKFLYKNIVVQHVLHPFYNNSQPNYSVLWHQVSNACNDILADRRWDFSKIGHIDLTDSQKRRYYYPKLKDILNTFLYTNINLYRVLGINQINQTSVYRSNENFLSSEIELEDNESLNLYDPNLAWSIYNYLEMYKIPEQTLDLSKTLEVQEQGKLEPIITVDMYQKFLQTKGILAYQHLGKAQFNHYYQIYKQYILNRGNKKATLSLDYAIIRDQEEIILHIEDKIWLENSTIIVMDSFHKLRDLDFAKKYDELPYALKFKALLILLLVNNDAMIDGQKVIIDNVIIRQMRFNGEKCDFIVKVFDNALLERVLKYYLRSLANPVLVHKAAIEQFARAMQECDRTGKPKNTFEECKAQARSKYVQDYKNYDLERIKTDIIFASIGIDYFEYIGNNNGLNDIIKIGEILTQLSG